MEFYLTLGVENLEQVEILRNLNRDTIQGYYYAKSMPLSKLIIFIDVFNESVKIQYIMSSAIQKYTITQRKNAPFSNIKSQLFFELKFNKPAFFFSLNLKLSL